MYNKFCTKFSHLKTKGFICRQTRGAGAVHVRRHSARPGDVPAVRLGAARHVGAERGVVGLLRRRGRPVADGPPRRHRLPRPAAAQDRPLGGDRRRPQGGVGGHPRRHHCGWVGRRRLDIASTSMLAAVGEW